MTTTKTYTEIKNDVISALGRDRVKAHRDGSFTFTINNPQIGRRTEEEARQDWADLMAAAGIAVVFLNIKGRVARWYGWARYEIRFKVARWYGKETRLEIPLESESAAAVAKRQIADLEKFAAELPEGSYLTGLFTTDFFFWLQVGASAKGGDYAKPEYADIMATLHKANARTVDWRKKAAEYKEQQEAEWKRAVTLQAQLIEARAEIERLKAQAE